MLDDTLEKLQRADHDVLIGIRVTLDGFITEYKQNRINDATRYADHEARIRALETVIEVNKGTQNTITNNRRTWLEIVGLVLSAALIIVSYSSGNH